MTAERNEEVLSGVLRVRERATAFAYAVLRDFHAAEDAVQEASLVAVRRIADYAGEGFDRWFWTILRNVLGGRIRAARKSPLLAGEELLDRFDASALADSPRLPEENVDRLIECLRKMGGTTARVFRWRFVDRRSCAEIASQLGRSVQATYALIKRGRQALKECVEARAHG